MLRSAHRSGTVPGTVYGIKPASSIASTLGATFFLIPTIGTRAITLTLGATGLFAGHTQADDAIDKAVLARMLKHRNGQFVHLTTSSSTGPAQNSQVCATGVT